MRKTLSVVAGLAVSTIGWGAGQQQLTICLAANPEVSNQTMAIAKGYAERIYRSIDIRLDWKSTCPEAVVEGHGASLMADLTVIGIEWAAHATPNASPRALATAHPFQAAGIRISLFQDRLAWALKDKLLAGQLLGHVMAHEIGHVLLGSTDHASEGLMKPILSAIEQYDLRRKPLTFSVEEAETIRQRLDPQIRLTASR